MSCFKGTIASRVPKKTWIEKTPEGKTQVWMQHQGHEPFLFVEINYSYKYTDNATNASLATEILNLLEE